MFSMKGWIARVAPLLLASVILPPEAQVQQTGPRQQLTAMQQQLAAAQQQQLTAAQQARLNGMQIQLNALKQTSLTAAQQQQVLSLQIQLNALRLTPQAALQQTPLTAFQLQLNTLHWTPHSLFGKDLPKPWAFGHHLQPQSRRLCYVHPNTGTQSTDTRCQPHCVASFRFHCRSHWSSDRYSPYRPLLFVSSPHFHFRHLDLRK